MAFARERVQHRLKGSNSKDEKTSIEEIVPSSRPGSEYGRSTLSELASRPACTNLSISNRVGLRIGSAFGRFGDMARG